MKSPISLFACASIAFGIASAQAGTEVVLHNFIGPPKGANPYTSVLRDSAGNLYGTTHNGGTANAGVIYKLDTAGRQTVLYTFTGKADGGSPTQGIIRDSAGNLYGTTNTGGTGNGVVYKLDTTRKHTVLYNFPGLYLSVNSNSALTRDSAGNLYGTSYLGGAANEGMVYKLDATGNFSLLYSFTGRADGAFPHAGVIRDSAGNLYGTTFGGGASGWGVVYRLDPAGHEKVLYTFKGQADGGAPYSGVVRDSAGNLYGATYNGGASFHGVVYKLDAAGHQTLLHTFIGGADGANPNAVVLDVAGNLYGTTDLGGIADGACTLLGGCGVAYKLDATGQQTILHSFSGGSDGSSPKGAGLVSDSAGNLYGTAAFGGASGTGVVYQLDAAGNETVLYDFPGIAGGYQPGSSVIRDSSGSFYGTTYLGGAMNAGLVYKLDATGHETVLYNFTGGSDGGYLQTGVVRDTAGNLYGTTFAGGASDAGVVYKIDASGHQAVLHNFTGADGGNPNALILDAAGNLYGTTPAGGTNFDGVVFKLDTSGNYTLLYSFTGGNDGSKPAAGVIQDSAGNLYGTTQYGGSGFNGVAYRLDAAGHQTILHSFTGGADGAYPSGLIRDSAGNLYGTAIYGGTGNSGIVYKLDATGFQTVLYNFTGGADGRNPIGGVIRDSSGNLYGTTSSGGAANAGVVFKLDASGNETVLYNFTGGSDGGDPLTGVIRDSAGNLYGTTFSGGPGLGGVLFKLKP